MTAEVKSVKCVQEDIVFYIFILLIILNLILIFNLIFLLNEFCQDLRNIYIGHICKSNQKENIITYSTRHFYEK